MALDLTVVARRRAVVLAGAARTWSNGGDFLNKDRIGGAVDQPAAVEALQRMSDLNIKDKAMPTAANSPEGGPKFENGRVAMYHNNSGNWLGYGQVPDLQWNIAPLPTGKQGTIARNPPNSWASWSGERAPDDTWLVIEELTTPAAAGTPSRCEAGLRRLAQAVPAQRGGTVRVPRALELTSPVHWGLGVG